ncbi:MAG: hypothetical protein ACE5F6_19570 [Anaerolineae bacterium]
MPSDTQYGELTTESEIEHYQIWVSIDLAAPSIAPDLAAEIGLNESIVLLQIDRWIRHSNIVRDGRRWTCQSAQDMQRKAFKWWGLDTIERALVSLVEQQLILTTDEYNQHPDDQTPWFALNPQGFKILGSIELRCVA